MLIYHLGKELSAKSTGGRSTGEKSMTEATQVLAGFAAALDYADLPDRVRGHTKNILLDTLACAIAGRHGEETEQVGALATALGESRESSVLGGDRLSLTGATLLNGY